MISRLEINNGAFRVLSAVKKMLIYPVKITVSAIEIRIPKSNPSNMRSAW